MLVIGKSEGENVEGTTQSNNTLEKTMKWMFLLTVSKYCFLHIALHSVLSSSKALWNWEWVSSPFLFLCSISSSVTKEKSQGGEAGKKKQECWELDDLILVLHKALSSYEPLSKFTDLFQASFFLVVKNQSFHHLMTSKLPSNSNILDEFFFTLATLWFANLMRFKKSLTRWLPGPLFGPMNFQLLQI